MIDVCMYICMYTCICAYVENNNIYPVICCFECSYPTFPVLAGIWGEVALFEARISALICFYTCVYIYVYMYCFSGLYIYFHMRV